MCSTCKMYFLPWYTGVSCGSLFLWSQRFQMNFTLISSNLHFCGLERHLYCLKLFLQLLSSILQSVEVWFKKHALELFQYSSVFFDNRIKLNSDLKAIVEMTRSNISPQLHAKLLNCQATSCTSFSMLRKLLVKDRHFSLGNVWKYLALYVNKSLE